MDERLTIRLTPEEALNLEIIHQATKLPKAQIIRGILDGWFKDNDSIIESYYETLQRS
jgi:hypothetical protein